MVERSGSLGQEWHVTTATMSAYSFALYLQYM
jgi:hypothetical protein